MGIVLFTLHISEKELAQPGELAHLGKFANARRIGTSRINVHLSRELTQLGELEPLNKRIDTAGRIGTPCQENWHIWENWHLPKEFAQAGKLALAKRIGTDGRIDTTRKIDTVGRISNC